MKTMKELFQTKTQDEIAEETGLHQTTVSYVKHNGAGGKSAQAIHRVYGIPYQDIFAWPPEQPDQAA